MTPAEERALRSAVRECIDDETLTRTGRSVGDIASGHVADAVLALPEIAALIGLRERVEAVVDRHAVRLGEVDVVNVLHLRAALDAA